nr:hypothetical protein [Tanacetum cinerariifolium]
MARKTVHFLGNVTPLFDTMLVQHQASEGEGSAIPLEPQPTTSTSQQPTSISRTTKTQKAEPQILASHIIFLEAPTQHEEGDRVERAITTGATLEAAQDSDNITKNQTMAMPNPNEPPLIEGHTFRSGEGRLEENIELTDTVPTPHDSHLTGGYTPRSDKDEEGPSVHIEDSPKQGRIIEEMDIYENINLTSVPLNLGADEDVNQEEGDRVERAITTDASLEAAQDSDNITKTHTTTMPNVDIPQVIDIGGRPRRQETMGEGHTSGSGEGRLEENIKLKDIVPTPNDPPLTGAYTPRCDEGRITLAELMETCTILSNRKRSRAVIHSSDKEGPSMHIEDSLKQRRIIEEMDKDENINLVKEQEEVQEIAEHSRDDDDDEETLAETLLNIKRSSTTIREKESCKRQRIWDQVHTFVPKDSEIEREVMKRAGFDLHQGSSKKQRLDQQTEETKEEARAQGLSHNGGEDLNTIPEKESDEFNKSSVENLVLIPSESHDTSGRDSECDLSSSDDFSPINVSKGKSYLIDHQEDLNQQRISNVHDRWDKLNESQNELLNMMQSFCKMVIQQKQAANIDQSSPQEISIQDMEDLKQHYLDEMKNPPSIAMTLVLPNIELKDFLIMGNEELSTIPLKEMNEVIKSSVEDLVLIPKNEWKKNLYDAPVNDLITENRVFNLEI